MPSGLKINFFLIIFLFSAGAGNASKIEKGFEALRVFDYFMAKKLFYEVTVKKTDPYAFYGLAIIYSRNDNPFSNIDSAGKYASLSYNHFHINNLPQTLGGFLIDRNNIISLIDTISNKMYSTVKKLNTISAYNFFLGNFYLANKKLLGEAVYKRDELEFNEVLEINKSDTTRWFMLLHPQSEFYQKAFILLEKQIYDENTKSGLADSYIAFLKNYPKSSMVKTAHEKLFDIYSGQKDLQGLASFVKNYPLAYQNIEAWKLLFSLTVKDFSFSELENFVKVYPEFPLKNSILKELELNKLELYPYQQGDLLGFIDEKAKFVIRPMFDAATDFYEGLSVVSKNDSAYFINKQNQNPFNKIFSEASVFKNGIAPVKQNNKWFFINRQGQSISFQYDEITELSENVYVVKLGDKYGALDHFGQVILEPKFEKLGDFKNGYAYYMEKGLYGFVSRNGLVYKAEFEWISDFNSSQVAIIKQNNKYGLVTTFGKKILEPVYDQIQKTNSPIFILVLNGLYGFFSSEGCFLTDVAFDFMKEKSPDFYTNGVLMKLLKRKEQAFIDVNGRFYINFGAYEEINFPNYDLMCVKQKNKYGYVDRKLNIVIPYKYKQAGDFSDSLALVKFKEYNTLITRTGSEVFSTGAEIVKLSSHYYSVNDDARSIINQRGELVFTEVENVQKVNRVLIITLNSGEIKLIYD